MLNSRRRLRVAALAAFVLGATATSLPAQETNTVGPPQLKDFSLPGQRTTPPPQPQPTLQAPPPAAQPPRAAAAAAAQPERAGPRRAAPAPARSGPAAAARLPAAAPPPAEVLPAPVGTLPPVSLPVPPSGAPAPAAAAPAAESGWTWLWPAGGLLLALLAGLGLRRLAAARTAARKRAQRQVRAAARAAEAAAASGPPVPQAAAGPRARLELDFVPERAVATEAETVVHYDIVLRNGGEEAAGNIRIDARMFNAGAQAAIGAFLKGPIHDRSGSPQITIAPGGELKLSSAIAMPRDEVRGIEVQGRSIFVPVVAINVAYDWGGAGAGRTSRSWLVGREPAAPSEKMGAFRLDLGPRIYRSVAQRPTELAHVA
jgi:hypothetical protein